MRNEIKTRVMEKLNIENSQQSIADSFNATKQIVEDEIPKKRGRKKQDEGNFEETHIEIPEPKFEEINEK